MARKPTLAYKLSSAGQKTSAINLRTSNDWSGLITHYTTKVQSKKDLSITITVLPDNVRALLFYLALLNPRLVHVLVAQHEQDGPCHKKRQKAG